MDDLYSKSAINFFNVNASFKKQLKISIVDIGDSWLIYCFGWSEVLWIRLWIPGGSKLF